MRVMTFLLTLVMALAFIVLNFLGFNETLSQTQFIFISAAAEILICFILGHFMFRTYANYRRVKQLTAELNAALGRPAKSKHRNKQAKETPAPVVEEPAAAPVDNDATTLFKEPIVTETANSNEE